jgi:hypothetical protein
MRKTLLALTGAATLAFAATSANAAVIIFNNPTGNLGTSETYTDGSLSVTAYGYTSGSASDLWGKNGAGISEQGLGLASDTSGQHEIWYNPNTFVSLDVTGLFGSGNIAQFSMGSTTLGEEWALYGSDVAGVLGTLLDTGQDQLNWYDFPNFGSYDFYNFVSLGTQHGGGAATTGNVLLHGIQVTSAVPEPATWAMMLIGFGAVGFSMRRRQRVALTQLA